MHSDTVDRTGSPKKRALSRGISEDESLRSIITEADSSTRRLTRSDSRCGTLKKRSDSQCEQDLLTGLPEMLELQASYEEVQQELHRLEEEREGLLFQVDVLQDSLEGTEELLAEAQREATQANTELEQEKEARRRLEELVFSLTQEVERLKEERNTIPAVPVYTLVREQEREEEQARHLTLQEQDMAMEQPPNEGVQGGWGAPRPGAPLSIIPLNTPTEPGPRGPIPEQQDEADGGAAGDGPLARLQRMVTEGLGHVPSLALGAPQEDGVLRRPNATEPDASHDDTDSVSAYEDASAETPELDHTFPGACPEGVEPPPHNAAPALVMDEEGEGPISDPQSPKNPDACVLS